jgi:hypothetical protein
VRRAPFLLLCGTVACIACSPSSETGDGDADDGPMVIDICDAFTGVGSTCPIVSPVLCFPLCEAGGCFCGPGDAGAVWECVNDLSCVPDCGPLDDGCP